jgi:hypothetical protein
MSEIDPPGVRYAMHLDEILLYFGIV